MQTLKLAVIGRDVTKSLSPEIHAFIAKHTGKKITYDKLSVPETRFEDTVEKFFEEYDGFNVTIPYKLSIIPHLEKVEGDAKAFGAVNTVRARGRVGYNTDGLGFSLMLKNAGVQVCGKRALVLGAGGAGRSAAKKLSEEGAEVYIYNRSSDKAKAVAGEFDGVTALEKLENIEYYLIVNATGVGMHETEGISPVDNGLLKLCTVAADLIYEPKKSKFLELAEQCGKQTINGEAMLFYQAYFAQKIFFGESADAAQAKELFAKYREEKF
ncbi:MAG: shikimate dehydrogenase [Clostridia bacterium]|nr:shikimate dehydrogenase [Clostridia bacterium]